MASFTINSRKHGEQTFTVRGDGKAGYVRLGEQQICEGGGFMGATIMATSGSLEYYARKWWTARLRRLAKLEQA